MGTPSRRAPGSATTVHGSHPCAGGSGFWSVSLRRTRAATIVLIRDALASAGTAWSDELVLRPSTSPIGSPEANTVVVGLANETSFQGLQLRLEYDAAVARPVAITALPRLGDPRRLHYWVEPGVIRALVCDLGTERPAIESGNGPILSVAFAPVDGADSDALRVSTGDALAVTGQLTSCTIPAARIEIHMSAAARSGERPGGGRAGALRSAQGEAQSAAPTRFALYDAGPNPSSTGAALALEVPRAGRVRVAVYDATGRLIRVLVDRFMEVGRYPVEWDGMTSDGTRPGASLFFVRVTAKGFELSHKVIALQ